MLKTHCGILGFANFFANSFRWVGVVVIIQLDGFWNRPFQRKGLLLNSVSWKPGRIVRGRQELGDAGQTLRTACAAHCTLYTAHTHTELGTLNGANGTQNTKVETHSAAVWPVY